MTTLTDLMTTEICLKEKRETFSERVLMMLHQQKRSKSWLAQEINVSKQALNYMLMHSASIKCVNEIALALSVNPEWLKTGEGSVVIHLQQRPDIRLVSVFAMSSLSLEQKDVSHSIAVSAAYSSNCFAVTLDNDSMEPLFMEGSLLIMDPAKKPKNRDYVLFSPADSQEVFFRQFFKEGKDCYFKAMAPMYGTIKQREFRLYGTLVESRSRFI